MTRNLGALGIFCLLGCGFPAGGPNTLAQTDTASVPARRGTVISNGCTLDAWQLETLGEPATKAVIHEVMLECILPHADGSVTPNDPGGALALSTLIQQLHELGYTVALAANFTEDNGTTFDGSETAMELADSSWVSQVASGIAHAAQGADEVDLDLEYLPASAQPNVTEMVQSVAAIVHPRMQLGIYLPPSTQSPSDQPGGDAFDIPAIAAFADRFRIMTLDYSGITPGSQPGPTIESGWAVDAANFVMNVNYTASVPIDVAFPLYGNDFTTSGSPQAVRMTSYLEATGLEATYGVTPTRGPTQELFFDYTDDAKQTHELWYDDATSTLVTLGAWDTTTLPPSVGVSFYGFGFEDPVLWTAIQEATQP